MQVSKHITKLIEPFNNADETYNIEVKYDYCLEKSLLYVYIELKNLLDNIGAKYNCLKISLVYIYLKIENFLNDYFFKKSLTCIYFKIKNLLDSKKRKFYYKIKTHINVPYYMKIIVK